MTIPIQSSFIKYTKQVSKDDAYLFAWSVDESAGLIKLEFDVKTTGWVGFGISPNGLMINSDMYMGYIKKDGSPSVTDRYSIIGSSLPELDSEVGGINNIYDIEGSLSSGRTKISFTRAFDTKDKKDQVITKGKKYSVIFSYRLDGNPDTEGTFNKHTESFAHQIILLPDLGQNVSPITLQEKYKNDPDVKSMSIVHNKWAISSVSQVTYSCQVFDLQKMIRDNESGVTSENILTHAIGMEALIDNSQFVHHISVLSCDLSSPFEYTPICGNVPTNCYTYVSVWFPGQGYTELPKEVGLFFGSFDVQFVVLQIHYANPTLIKDQVDSSGINFFYTKKIRQYDLALAQYGAVQPTHGLSIEPGKTSVIQEVQCPKACFDSFPDEGIKIISYFLHGHDLLRKIRAEIIDENGAKDMVTFRNDHFDHTHQELINLPTSYVIKKGMGVNVVCEYDSSSRNTTTIAGGNWGDEMCAIFVYYYPRRNGPTFCLDKSKMTDMICYKAPEYDGNIVRTGTIISHSSKLLFSFVFTIFYILFFL